MGRRGQGWSVPRAVLREVTDDFDPEVRTTRITVYVDDDAPRLGGSEHYAALQKAEARSHLAPVPDLPTEQPPTPRPNRRRADPRINPDSPRPPAGPESGVAQKALNDLLKGLGQPVPCADPVRMHWWTGSTEERRAAVHLCSTCPASAAGCPWSGVTKRSWQRPEEQTP